MRATQRLYLTWDRKKVVPESNPDGRFLFCKPGDEVPDEEAKKYGLLEEKKAAAEPKPVLQQAAPPAPKTAPARKAQTPGEDLDAHSDEELQEIARTMEVESKGGREALIVAILKKAGYTEEAEAREKKAAAQPENKMAGKPQDKGAHFPPQSRRR